MTTGYYLLDHPNPNAGRFGGFWGYATMLQTPRVIVVHSTESFADFDGPDRRQLHVAGCSQGMYGQHAQLQDAADT